MLKTKYVFLVTLLLSSSIFLSSCSLTNNSKKAVSPTPTISQLVELKPEDKPIISLVPRTDGHQLKLIISHIPSFVKQIEYELIYTAVDNGLEIEKGVGDTVKLDQKTIERDILLGTSSCTNGCKYKYDEGVNGGIVNLTLIGDNNQVSTTETPFVLKTSADIRKTGGLTLATDNYTLKGTVTGNDYYIMLKNPLNYSVFSSGSKNTLTGDHPLK